MKVIRSVFFYIVLFFATLLCGIAAIAVVFVTRRDDVAHLIGRFWGNVNLWAAGVSVEVEGLENIERDRPYIYASNHQSWFDIFAVMAKVPVQFRWLAKQELYRIPVLGQAMSAIGYIPIDRSDRHKAFESLNEAAQQVRNGTSIFIFPEGTRSRDGVLQEFKKGGFILAIHSQQPIVPIGISGSHGILPKQGTWVLQPGRIRMTVGKPVPTEGLSVADRNRLIRDVRDAIRQYLPEREGGTLSQESPHASSPSPTCKGSCQT